MEGADPGGRAIQGVGPWIARIAVSNLAGAMEIFSCDCCVSCRYRSQRRADHSSREVLPNVCMSHCVIHNYSGGR